MYCTLFVIIIHQGEKNPNNLMCNIATHSISEKVHLVTMAAVELNSVELQSPFSAEVLCYMYT